MVTTERWSLDPKLLVYTRLRASPSDRNERERP
jgi:hypothetical protein